ncbi:presenilin family intramembrane aspartyl protease PSH [Natronosalvus rutilus]|uniref:Presenilin family intramembrane aspartyl protease n=1 Tax=Natronosalvus rutilus TaxID=2953753 RepID=A0A9E7N924_9EURY|nr:presenilin family intramembrane aspartyl protease PSH [Natronosalvus rutilus]UTF53091.1 presenilin family intramembrane aspartyl protease [Natronosalvus rutilus]
MNERIRLGSAVGFTCLLFIGVQFGALALVEPFTAAEMQAVEDPSDPTNSLVYVGAILVMTAFMLAAFKYDLQWIIRGLIVGVSVMLSWFVFAEILPPVATIASFGVFPLLVSLGIGAALVIYPEWYVIDLAGVVMGAGAAGLFGISFGLLPALVLLVVLAVYDAISVYRTEHMLDLAEGVMDLHIPVVLVVPTSLSYSFLEAGDVPGEIENRDAESTATTNGGSPEADADDFEGPTAEPTDSEAAEDERERERTESEQPEPEQTEPELDDASEGVRDALFIGLGDAVIPTILIASAASFLEVGSLDVPLITLNAPALGGVLGTLAGLLVLMAMVLRGRPHAGLPLLNSGAIGGYLVGALWAGVPVATALGL